MHGCAWAVHTALFTLVLLRVCRAAPCAPERAVAAPSPEKKKASFSCSDKWQEKLKRERHCDGTLAGLSCYFFSLFLVIDLVFFTKEAETIPGATEDEDDGDDEETDEDDGLGVLQLGGELGLIRKEVVAEA